MASLTFVRTKGWFDVVESFTGDIRHRVDRALVAMFVVYLLDKRAIERLVREYETRVSDGKGGELTDG